MAHISPAQITGNRDRVFQWLRSYLDYRDTLTVLRDADNSNQKIRQYAPMRKGFVHVRNHGGTYTATFTPAS